MQIWQSAFNTNNSSGHNAHFIKLWIVIVLDVYSCFIKAKATSTRLPFYWDYRHGKFDKILQKENGNCFHFGIYQVHFTTKSSDVSQHPNTHPKTKKKKVVKWWKCNQKQGGSSFKEKFNEIYTLFLSNDRT